MTISVIIPAYKARRYLSDCLESIGQQTRLPEEVIVVDDASTEAFDDIVSAFSSLPGYPPIRLLKHRRNQGQAAARNTGITACAGDWLAFLDHDDVWDPEHLEQLEKTASDTQADLVFCPAKLFVNHPGEEGMAIAQPSTGAEKQFSPFALMRNCFIITSSCMIRSSRLAQVGGFDATPAVRAVEDLDCFLKLLRTGARFAMAPRATLNYRKHPESATGRKGYMIRQIVFVTERHLGWVEGTRKEKFKFRSRLAWNAAIETSITRAPDRWAWFFRALRLTAMSPYTFIHSLARYARAHCIKVA